MLKLLQSKPHKVDTSKHFERIQKEHFEEAESQRFQWQTTNPLIKAYETELLKVLVPFLNSADRLLEVGCGEGANLVNLPVLHRPKIAVGVDFSLQKSRFWLTSTEQAGVTESCSGLCADATRLPLADATFDLVFCRDLLHHVTSAQQAKVVDEMFRLCKPGGRVILIESNGRNPIIFLHALLIKAERGEFKSSPTLFRELLETAGGKNLQLSSYEPLPVFRLALHYRFGLPGLGYKAQIRRFFKGLDKLASWMIPAGNWAYVVAQAEKPL